MAHLHPRAAASSISSASRPPPLRNSFHTSSTGPGSITSSANDATCNSFIASSCRSALVRTRVTMAAARSLLSLVAPVAPAAAAASACCARETYRAETRLVAEPDARGASNSPRSSTSSSARMVLSATVMPTIASRVASPVCPRLLSSPSRSAASARSSNNARYATLGPLNRASPTVTTPRGMPFFSRL
jgi:hypothetical protein